MHKVTVCWSSRSCRKSSIWGSTQSCKGIHPIDLSKSLRCIVTVRSHERKVECSCRSGATWSSCVVNCISIWVEIGQWVVCKNQWISIDIVHNRCTFNRQAFFPTCNKWIQYGCGSISAQTESFFELFSDWKGNCTVSARAYDCTVREDRHRFRLCSRTGCIVVRLKAVWVTSGIGHIFVADRKEKLYFTTVSKVGIEVVVNATVSNKVLAIDCSSKPLKRVVARKRNLHVIYNCLVTYRTKGNTIDFFVRLEWNSCKFYANIA